MIVKITGHVLEDSPIVWQPGRTSLFPKLYFTKLRQFLLISINTHVGFGSTSFCCKLLLDILVK